MCEHSLYTYVFLLLFALCDYLSELLCAKKNACVRPADDILHVFCMLGGWPKQISDSLMCICDKPGEAIDVLRQDIVDEDGSS